MSVWSTHDPGVCNLGQLDNAISTMATMISKTSAIHTNVTANVTGVTDDVWSGTGVVEWRSGGSIVAGQVRTFHDALVAVHSATSRYRTSVSGLQSAAENWKGDVREADWVLHQTHVGPQHPTPEQVEEAEAPLRRARQKKEHALHALENLARTRETYDTTYITAIRGALPSGWEERRKALAAIGLDTVAEFGNPTEVRNQMIDLAERMIDGDVSDENVAALSALLSVWGNSQTTMSTVFTKLGGANVAQLIDQLAEGVSTAAGWYGTAEEGDLAILALAQQVRSGLAVGAEDWTQTFANGYMTDMLTGNAEYFEGRLNDQSVDGSSFSARAQAVSFLFSDSQGTPMPEPLVVGAALAIDELERIGGISFENYTPREAGIGASVFSLLVDTNDLSCNDLAGRVFETLGLYPEAALDFLSEDGRVDYWYGERDWSASDGFAGPSALWFGAAQVPGEESAFVASEIMLALSTNESFSSEYVSEEGSAYLAGALSVDLAAMAEYAGGLGSLGLPDSPGYGEAGTALVSVFGTDGTTDTPKVTLDVLLKMLGMAGAHDAGALILGSTASAWEEARFAFGAVNPDAFMEAMNQTNTLQGIIDGSGVGEQIAAAERSDARREEMIQGISMLLGAIPVPQIGGVLVEGGLALIDFAQNLFVSGGLSALTDLAVGGTPDYTAALLQAEHSEYYSTQAREYANAMSLYNYLQTDAAQSLLNLKDVEGPGAPPQQKAGESTADFLGRVNDWTRDPAFDSAGKTALGNDYFSLGSAISQYTEAFGDAQGQGTK